MTARKSEISHLHKTLKGWFNGKVCNHLPSGNTCRIFRYDVVSRMIEALSNCDVIALGSGRSFASSRNSAFSFSRRDRAAFLLFSFMAQRADKPKRDERKFMNQSDGSAVIKMIYSIVKNRTRNQTSQVRSGDNLIIQHDLNGSPWRVPATTHKASCLGSRTYSVNIQNQIELHLEA